MTEGQLVQLRLTEWSCLAFSNLDRDTYVIYILPIKLYSSTPRAVADDWKRVIGHYIKGKSGDHQ